MFTVNSIGDSAFLEQIMIAVAMITGTGDFKQLVSIGMLLGVFIICFQSLFQGAQKVDLQQVFVCWVLYALMFGTSTTVLIEDAYDGSVRPVSNVPLGVGAAAGIISSLGYGATKLMETGYGIIAPGITESQFADSLKILNDTRRKIYDPLVISAINQSNGGGSVDYRRSLLNYIQDCTLVKVDLGESSLDNIFGSNVDTALRFDSNVYGTQIYNQPGNSDGAYYDCSTGFGYLDNMTSRIATPQVDTAIASVLGINTAYGSSAQYRTTDALSALGAAGTDGYEYMKAAVIEPAYYEAATGKYQDMQDFSSALMVNQAIQQRNTQWAAEQSMFMSIVRPMMTFIEGFVFAVTPIMGFLIALGGFGVKLAMRYLQMLLWIQLWMPLLSIINLFVYVAATMQMSSYALGGVDNFYALNKTDDILQSWIATGGMLAAATPILALVLVTGSTYAMTSLAGRMQGGDTIDEKMRAPDTVKNGPVMANMAESTNDVPGGARATGSDALMPSLSLGSTLQSNVQSSEAVANAKQQAFGTSLSNAVRDSVAHGQGFQTAASLGQSMQSVSNEGVSTARRAAADYSRDNGLSASQQKAVEGAMMLSATGNLSAGVPIGGAGSAVGANGSLSGNGSMRQSENNQLTMDNKTAMKYLEGAGYTSDMSAQLSQSIATQMQDQSSEEFKSSLSSDNASQVQKSSQESVSATEQFQEVESAARSIGSQQSLNLGTLGEQIAGNRSAQQSVQEHLQSLSGETRQNVFEEMNRLEETYSDPEGAYKFAADKAKYTAAAVAMHNPDNYDDAEAYRGYNAIVRAAGIVTGQNYEPAGNAYEQQPMSDRVQSELDSVSPREQADNLAAPRQVDRQSVAETASQSPQGMYEQGKSAALLDNMERKDDVGEVANANGQEIYDESIETIRPQLRKEPDVSLSASTFATGDAATDQLANAYSSNASAETGYTGSQISGAANVVGHMNSTELETLQSQLDNGATATQMGLPMLEGKDGVFPSVVQDLINGSKDMNSPGAENQMPSDSAVRNLARETRRDQAQELSTAGPAAEKTREYFDERVAQHREEALGHGLSLYQAMAFGAEFDNTSPEEKSAYTEQLMTQELDQMASERGLESRHQLPEEVKQDVSDVYKHIHASAQAGDQAPGVMSPAISFNQANEHRNLADKGGVMIDIKGNE